MITLRSLVILLFVAISSQALFSQPVQPTGPRVGLVLSGGGAKGFAYVGMLKVLEEAGVRVDYIGGTSAGAILGGLYASGLKAAQLDSLVRNTDMWAVITGEVPRASLSWFEKAYGEKYVFSLALEGMKVALPAGLSNGQQLFDLFFQWTAHVSHIRDFQQLPIPFFCIATDVETGEEVRLVSGSLPLAMRASGALPGMLAPIEINGRLLTDGGVVNNFPAKEVRDRGMDYVIGLNVETDMFEKSELQSVEKLIMQITLYQSDLRSKAQRKFCDLLIHPDLQGYSLTDFDMADSLIAIGEREARKYWSELVRIAQLQKQQNSFRAVPNVREFTLDAIQLEGEMPFPPQQLQRFLPVHKKAISDLNELRARIEDLYATGLFSFIEYRPIFDEGGKNRLLIRPHLRQGYDTRLRLGLHFDDVYKSAGLMNLTWLNIFGIKGSASSLDIILGDKLRYNYHFFLEWGGAFNFGFNSFLRYNNISYQLPQPIALGENQELTSLSFKSLFVGNEVYWQFLTKKHQVMGLAQGIQFFKSRAREITNYSGEAGFADERSFYLTTELYYRHDTRNERQFFTEGMKLVASGKRLQLMSAPDFAGQNRKPAYNLDLHMEVAWPVDSRMSFGLELNAGQLFGSPMQPWYYVVGGNNRNFINNHRRFLGLPFGGEIGTGLLTGSFFTQINHTFQHYLSFSMNAALVHRQNSPVESDRYRNFYSLGLGYGIETLLGPLEASFAYGNAGAELYFNLGYWF